MRIVAKTDVDLPGTGAKRPSFGQVHLGAG